MSGAPETVSPTLLLAIELYGAFHPALEDLATENFFNLNVVVRDGWVNVARLVEAKIVRAVEADAIGNLALRLARRREERRT